MRRHPGSGRKTLYLSAHASHIVGWPIADGRLLLLDLNTHATQRQFVYSHQWRVGDLVIWDNRCTMHRGRPHDESQPRDLRRATTLDTSRRWSKRRRGFHLSLRGIFNLSARSEATRQSLRWGAPIGDCRAVSNNTN